MLHAEESPARCAVLRRPRGELPSDEEAGCRSIRIESDYGDGAEEERRERNREGGGRREGGGALRRCFKNGQRWPDNCRKYRLTTGSRCPVLHIGEYVL